MLRELGGGASPCSATAVPRGLGHRLPSWHPLWDLAEKGTQRHTPKNVEEQGVTNQRGSFQAPDRAFASKKN